MRTWIIALLAAAVPVVAAAQTRTTFTNADLNRKPAAIKPVPDFELVWLRSNQFVPQEKDVPVAVTPNGGERFLVFGRPDEGKETTPWYVYTFHGALVNNGLTFFPLLMPTLPVSAMPQPVQPLTVVGTPSMQR